MKTVIGEWIIHIAVIAILGALVDIILPNSSFRKYSGFIFGLVILVMFLQPFFRLLDQAQNFDNTVLRNALAMNAKAAAYQSSQLEEKQKQLLEDVFKASLEKDLANQLIRDAGLRSASVEITFRRERGDTDLSSIERIQVTVETEDQAVFIEPVIIGSGRNAKNRRTLTNEKVNEIKGILSELCQLEESRIFVNGK